MFGKHWIAIVPAGHTKLSFCWLTHVDTNGRTISTWCRKGKDDFHACCQFCDSDIKCDNSSRQQLLQLAKKDKHKQAIKYTKDNKQTKLFFGTASSSASSSTGPTTSKLEFVNYSNASLEAQIIWKTKMANYNLSRRSCDHIGKTFQEMFPNSKITGKYSLSRSSASYMILEGMAPHFKKTIVEDLIKSEL